MGKEKKAVAAGGFDYDAVPAKERSLLRQRSGEIKALTRQSVQGLLDIGRKLLEAKAALAHGSFAAWLNAEFDWSERSARNFMQVAERFKSANFADLTIEPSALYELAAPKAPEEAAKVALDRARKGEVITHAKAREIIKAVEARPPVEAGPPPATPRPAAETLQAAGVPPYAIVEENGETFVDEPDHDTGDVVRRTAEEWLEREREAGGPGKVVITPDQGSAATTRPAVKIKPPSAAEAAVSSGDAEDDCPPPQLKDPGPLDDAGLPVPAGMAEAFKSRALFDEAIKAVRRAQRLVADAAAGPGGEVLRQDMQAHRGEGDSVRFRSALLRDVHEQLKYARPHACVCPGCLADLNPKCQRCGGRGWVTSLTWKNTSGPVRADAEAFRKGGAS